eukprot:CAMPEP_0119425024 /NCGR_PEP_ID=MMETSP1335-20130426/33706_1 /TAXON_ID=259385 /ORGANISM="Chrysoculter rhomboideus, Strain RCC1486" /LENGTH=57 /DNA_ID=CAMNT_0007450575 /DNA_START=291 /DNA_END=464 /DNA_ORIENTATION=-
MAHMDTKLMLKAVCNAARQANPSTVLSTTVSRQRLVTIPPAIAATMAASGGVPSDCK